MQLRLLANLAGRPADGIHICNSRSHQMAAHPLQKIAIGIKSLAKGEDLAQARPGAVCELGKERFGRAIAVAEEGEVDRGIPERLLRAIKFLKIAERFVLQDDEAREM